MSQETPETTPVDPVVTPVQETSPSPVIKNSKSKMPMILLGIFIVLILCGAIGAAVFRFFGYAEVNGDCLFVGKYSVEVPEDSACYDQYQEENEEDDKDADRDDNDDSQDDSDQEDDSNERDLSELEDFTVYEGEGYSIYYPSDWKLDESDTIPVISEVELGTNEIGTFNPNINIVSKEGYDGVYTQSICETIGDSAAAGNQTTYDYIEVDEVDLIDTDYAERVCVISYSASIQSIPLAFTQYVFTSEESERTVALTIVSAEDDMESFDLLETIVDTVRLED